MRRNDGQVTASRTQGYWKSGAHRQLTRGRNAIPGKSLRIIWKTNRDYRNPIVIDNGKDDNGKCVHQRDL